MFRHLLFYCFMVYYSLLFVIVYHGCLPIQIISNTTKNNKNNKSIVLLKQAQPALKFWLDKCSQARAFHSFSLICYRFLQISIDFQQFPMNFHCFSMLCHRFSKILLYILSIYFYRCPYISIDFRQFLMNSVDFL